MSTNLTNNKAVDDTVWPGQEGSICLGEEVSSWWGLEFQ